MCLERGHNHHYCQLEFVSCSELAELFVIDRDRFGLAALRIWRLLLLKCHMEQMQIADLAMLDAKETRSLLYRMLKAGYVAMQVTWEL